MKYLLFFFLIGIARLYAPEGVSPEEALVDFDSVNNIGNIDDQSFDINNDPIDDPTNNINKTYNQNFDINNNPIGASDRLQGDLIPTFFDANKYDNQISSEPSRNINDPKLDESKSQPERTITLKQDGDIQKTTTDRTPDENDPTLQKSDPQQEQTDGLGKKQSGQAPESKESKSITNIDAMRTNLQQEGVLPDENALDELLTNLPEKMSDTLKAKLKLLTEELIEACNRDLSELGTKKINKQKLELLRTIHEKYSALYKKLNTISEKGNFLLVKNAETDIAKTLKEMQTMLDTIKKVINGEKKISSLNKGEQTDSKIIIQQIQQDLLLLKKQALSLKDFERTEKRAKRRIEKLKSRKRLGFLDEGKIRKLDALGKKLQSIIEEKGSPEQKAKISKKENLQAVKDLKVNTRKMLAEFDKYADRPKSTDTSINPNRAYSITGPTEEAQMEALDDPDSFKSIQEKIREGFLKEIEESLNGIEKSDQELSKRDQELSDEQLKKTKEPLVKKRQFALFLLGRMHEVQESVGKKLEQKTSSNPEEIKKMKDELNETQDQINDLIEQYDPRYRPLETAL